jgi:hypothetical protein
VHFGVRGSRRIELTIFASEHLNIRAIDTLVSLIFPVALRIRTLEAQRRR